MCEFFTDRLREAVAAKFQRRIATTCDFNQLSESIKTAVNDTLGPSTLKRIWEYIEPHRRARQSSLDILARYAGYDDFASFCQVVGETCVESGFLSANVFYANSANVGDMIEISWKPNRRIEARCTGDAVFEVELNENSHLVVGSVIRIPYLIEGRTMVADVLLPGSARPVVYEAGRNGGISWRCLEEPKDSPSNTL